VKPALVVIAKAPVPGRAKTRLSPPCSATEAAELAAAALADTLAAVAATPARRRILALDGVPGAWLPPGFEVVPQASGGLDRRLGAAIETASGPAIAVGMDTPQLTDELLTVAVETLMTPGTDAVLGPAADGGYWAIGMRRPCRAAIAGVPMSVPWTAAAQRSRLHSLGLRSAELTELRDVDTYDDACAVAQGAPGTRFAECFASVQARRPADSAVAGTG
jgi:uncharacterized protein